MLRSPNNRLRKFTNQQKNIHSKIITSRINRGLYLVVEIGKELGNQVPSWCCQKVATDLAPDGLFFRYLSLFYHQCGFIFWIWLILSNFKKIKSHSNTCAIQHVMTTTSLQYSIKCYLILFIIVSITYASFWNHHDEDFCSENFQGN